MGTYGKLIVANYAAALYWSGVDSEIATVFTERDRFAGLKRTIGDSPIEYMAYEYRTTGKFAAERLDVMGFTVRRARREFERWSKREHESESASGGEREKDELTPLSTPGISFDSWLAAVAAIISKDIYSLSEDPSLCSTAERFVLENSNSAMGYPVQASHRLFLRALLMAVPQEVEVSLDFTDVVYDGLCSPDIRWVEKSQRELREDAPAATNVAIVMEGKSDIRILQCALACLSPHLKEYFTFFDFHSSKVRGGAPSVINTVKAFAAAKISDRIVALVDNDTAGHDALRALRGIQIPANIICLPLPDLELAKTYPTIGPGGLQELDVNGLAGGIELYLGRDTLTFEGQLAPVQWRGYNSSLERYQGELLDKEKVQGRFFSLVEKWKKKPEEYPERDWSGLQAIIDMIRSAFV